ncbi:unnamed protein product [Orchesella dallaii]|uniref:AN1-type domain-containing protein n=1 Tax=Orchesella dallaii TaxID=48710 RepID=A0ABP1QWH8_9HEXA
MVPPRRNSNGKLPGSSSSISLNESPTEETNYDSDISDDDHAIAEDDDEEEEELDEGFELEVSTLTGISPADQNLLLEQGNKLLTASNTIQELNIDRNSKLTLVTNVASGVPFKQYREVGDPLLSFSSSTSKLAPTIKRNYGHSHNHNNNSHQTNPQSSSIRLPKILTTNNMNNHQHGPIVMRSTQNPDQGMPNMKNSSGSNRLDEREWMQSLFNKVVQQDEDDEGIGDNIDMDSTTYAAAAPPPYQRMGNGKNGTLPVDEDDDSILIVQGDDGVILIIQKNTGPLLDDSFESGYDKNNNSRGIDMDNMYSGNGRIQRMGGRYKSSTNSNSTRSYNSHSHSKRYNQDTSVHDKIKENAVTLEKMRQLRGMMAQKHQADKTSSEPPTKTLEFPKISDNSSHTGLNGFRKDSVSENRSFTYGGGQRKDNRSATTRTPGVRSINSSKMSLNRLIAEIYLQSKRKGHSFQPGQPPYTEQQLLKYVQLKVAILLDEQKKQNTEPCSKCQLDGDWVFDEDAPYLVPTVVMNRYKRLANVRNSKSLDKETTLNGMSSKRGAQSGMRRSLIPVPGQAIVKSKEYPTRTISDSLYHQNHGDNNEEDEISPTLMYPNITIASSHSTKSSSSATTRRFSNSSSSTFTKLDIVDERNNNEICDVSIFHGDDDNDEHHHEIYPHQRFSSQRIYLTNNRPSYKIHPKIYGNNGYSSKKSSRPGSSSKSGTGKKGVRCNACRKKLGIACRYQCRCGLTFCSVHRYPEAHECTFDYKTEGRNKIREENPVIVAPKIQNI